MIFPNPQPINFAATRQKTLRAAHQGTPAPCSRRRHENENRKTDATEKQIFKILRHLKADIERSKPEVKTPSTWMLKQLVKNSRVRHSASAELQTYHWPKATLLTLRMLETQLEHPSKYPVMLEQNSTRPLFSTCTGCSPKERYSQKHALQFVRAAMHYFAYSLGGYRPNKNSARNTNACTTASR